MVPNVQRTVSWSGQLARRTMATGVSGERPPPQQGFAPLPRGGHAHVKHQRAGEPGQGLVVQFRAGAVAAAVAGDQGHGRGQIAMGDGDAGMAGHGEGGRDAGHDFVRECPRRRGPRLLRPRGRKRYGSPLLSRTTVCRPGRRRPCARLISCWSISRPPCGWPRRDLFRRRRHMLEQLGIDQVVVEHQVGLGQALQCRGR